MSYLDPSHRNGIAFPQSGQFVGDVAMLLREHGYLASDWVSRYKTAPRYFQGKPVDEAPEILRTLVNAIVPSVSMPRTIVEHRTTMPEWIASAIEELLQQWDTFAGSMSGVTIPFSAGRLAALPFMRLVVLDLGIRVAAFHVLDGTEPADSIWLSRDALGETIERLRRGSTTNDSFDLEAWRTGARFPARASLHSLALSVGLRGTDELQLMAAAGIVACRSYLEKLCGRNRIDDLVAALATTIRSAHRSLDRTLILGDDRSSALRDLVRSGARAREGRRLVHELAESTSLHTEVKNDLLALPGCWSPRLSYWAKKITRLSRVPADLPRSMNVTVARARELAARLEEIMFAMKGNYER